MVVVGCGALRGVERGGVYYVGCLHVAVCDYDSYTLSAVDFTFKRPVQ